MGSYNSLKQYIELITVEEAKAELDMLNKLQAENKAGCNNFSNELSNLIAGNADKVDIYKCIQNESKRLQNFRKTLENC
jgi:hypothetical protein